MNIAFTFKNFEPSEHLKSYAKKRFEKISRFLSKAENADMAVTLIVDKFRHRAEVLLTGDNLNISAMEQSEDMYASVDMILDKIEVQIKKHGEKLKEHRRNAAQGIMRGNDAYHMEDGSEHTIVVTNDFYPKPLHLEEAALQLEQREDDIFLVFKNADNDRINVMYRRKNGDFGVIDPGK